MLDNNKENLSSKEMTENTDSKPAIIRGGESREE